ncbi:MAG: mechanosensitive ion channel family protein [Phaeodactylibacter sp.]|uniref:mechanosensitive ion channel family protein n=1 Tax=Phaeodactylibacter sp. TaxID=1940289 RepID=UPI0032EC9E1A
MRLLRPVFNLLLAALLTPLWLSAQNNDAVPVTLETPYNTALVHLHYLQTDSYQPGTAARTLYGVADSTRASRLAIRLKQVYDGMGLYVRLNRIPRDANYMDSTVMQSVFTPFPNELPQVYLEKVDGKWYYSEETVNQINTLHEEVYPFGTDLLLQLIPRIGDREVLGMKAWQLVGLILLLVLAILVHLVLSRLLKPVVRQLSHSRIYPSLVPPKLIWTIARLISVLVVVRMLRLFVPTLQLPIEAANFTVVVIKLITIMLVVGILFRVLDVIILYANKGAHKTESKMDEQLLPVIQRGVQFLIFAGAIIQSLRVFQVDITTLIAGISIGGLAIALAAQDTLKNLFGSLTIFMDKPFQVGDWINFAGVDGMVEEVGFRSTRVRTFANSLVYVPNGKLADMVVNNYGLRHYRRFNTTLSLTYDTPPELIEKFVEGLKGIVANHPLTRKDYYEVHLNGMGSHSLDILFYIFFEAPTWSEELKGRHEILLEVLKLGKALGVRFAFPTQTLHLEEMPGTMPTTPHYTTDPKELDQRLQAFMKK